MKESLLVLPWLLPLLLSLLPLRRAGIWSLAVAPGGAFALVVFLEPDQQLTLDWLLLGTHLVWDELGFWFLLSSALVWLFAALYRMGMPERGYGVRGGRGLFLAAMAGNFLLVLAGDALTFYLGFALMGLSAYGLVVGRRSQRARRAGRSYLVWTLGGELALFCALVLIAVQAPSLGFIDLADHSLSAPAVGLLLFGFGIKLALPGLHFWMPAAYSASPGPAAAVLAGPMFNAGLLGLLRFLPAGQPGLADWSSWLLSVGMAGVVAGIALGIITRSPRKLLGYSSMVKSGTLVIGLAVAWRHPEAAPAILPALVLFAMHHLLVKGGFFLGLGIWERVGSRPWVLLGLLLLALGLAGGPLTAGALSKAELGRALAVAGVGPGWGLTLGGIGSVLLMVRLFLLIGRERRAGRTRIGGAMAAWWVLVVLSLGFPAGIGAMQPHLAAVPSLAVGLLFAGLGGWLIRRWKRSLPVAEVRRLNVMLRRCGRLRFWFDLPSIRIPIPAWPKGQAKTPPSLAVGGQGWMVMLLLLLLLLANPW